MTDSPRYAFYVVADYYQRQDDREHLVAVPMSDATDPARLIPAFHTITRLTQAAPESNLPTGLVTQIKTENPHTGAVRYAWIVAHDQPLEIPIAPAPIVAIVAQEKEL